MQKNRKNNYKVRGTISDKVFTVFVWVFLIVFIIITLYPVLNTVVLSFNDGIDAVRGRIYLWPRKFSMKNYKTVMAMQNIWTGAKVTVLRTIIATITSLFANALLAFVVSRKKFMFRSELSLFWVITMYVN